MSEISVAKYTVLYDRKPLLKRIKEQKYLLLLVVPAVLWMLIFCYWPIYGVTIAFKEYNIAKGVWGSPWIGFKYFNELFSDPLFYNSLKNTMVISFLKLICGFPIPILFAILLNELTYVTMYKRVIQTISYLPHFLSWVFVVGFMVTFLSNSGLINTILMTLGILGKPVAFLADPQWFVTVVVLSDVWKGFGFNSIIFLAAITTIELQLYESATIDGASRFQKIRYITLPSIKPTIVVLFILAVSNLINQNFDQLYLLQNPLVSDSARILEIYTYEIGLKKARFSYATAIGIFKSVTAFILLISANTLSRKLTDESVY